MLCPRYLLEKKRKEKKTHEKRMTHYNATANIKNYYMPEYIIWVEIIRHMAKAFLKFATNLTKNLKWKSSCRLLTASLLQYHRCQRRVLATPHQRQHVTWDMKQLVTRDMEQLVTCNMEQITRDMKCLRKDAGISRRNIRNMVAVS